jgi:hypothetical protein
VVTGTVTGYLVPPRSQIEAQLIPALLGDAALVEDDVEYPIFYSPEPAWTFLIRLFRYLRWQ